LKTVLKQFQNCFVSVLFQFYFNCADCGQFKVRDAHLDEALLFSARKLSLMEETHEVQHPRFGANVWSAIPTGSGALMACSVRFVRAGAMELFVMEFG